jgi:hypothetical protein
MDAAICGASAAHRVEGFEGLDIELVTGGRTRFGA